jgi:hypothetical protein
MLCKKQENLYIKNIMELDKEKVIKQTNPNTFFEAEPPQLKFCRSLLMANAVFRKLVR